MKKILITGAGSYIGTSFEKYITENFPDEYTVDTVDMIGEEWKKFDFSNYDTVFHVAGIAHKKETRKNHDLYYRVNKELAIETANKAASSGVKQFVFLSSLSVYGLDEGIITQKTSPKPKTNYGKSKLQAELEIKKLDADKFKICILRPPMVYGNGCKGNFQVLKKIALQSSFFPKVNNQRSMIYIENLCEFVRLVIENEENGIFFPQNDKYVNTSEFIKLIGEAYGKKIKIISGFEPIIKCFFFVKPIKKAFGSLIYLDHNEPTYDYCNLTFNDSVKRSV